LDKFKKIGEFVASIIDAISRFFSTATQKINAKTEQIVTINDARNKSATDAIKSTEISTVVQNQTESNKIIENQVIKTENTDKLISALDKNTQSTDEDTKVQKDKKDEWKGRFKTYIVKDMNAVDKTIANNEVSKTNNVTNELNKSNATSDIAKTSIKNEENVINTQKEVLKSQELNKSNVSKENIVNKTNTIAEKSIRNEENISNIQREVLKENNISNTSNIEERNFETVKQKSIQPVEGQTMIPSKRATKRDEIVINVVDKTGSKFGLQIESTGIDLIRTGNA